MGDFRDSLPVIARVSGISLDELNKIARPKRGRRTRPDLAKQQRQQQQAANLDRAISDRKQDRAETLAQVDAAQLPNRTAKNKYVNLRKQSPGTPREEIRKKDAKHLGKVENQVRNLSAAHKDAHPKIIPAWLYIRVQAILADLSGLTGRIRLNSHPNYVATGLLKPALKGGLNGDNPRARRNRRLVAELILFLGLATETRRKGDRWGLIVKGIPEAAICACLADPYTRKRPNRSSLSGTHKGRLKKNQYGKVIDKRTDGTVGYTRALKNLRILYTRQAKWLTGERPPTRGWENATINELPPTRTASGLRVSLARYWLVSPRWTSPYNDAEKARLYAAFIEGLTPLGEDLAAESGPRTAQSSEPEPAAQGPPGG